MQVSTFSGVQTSRPRVGRVSRSWLAIGHVLEGLHRHVAHLERTLANLPEGQAFLHLVDLHRQRIGNDQRQ